jgi:6-phosphogluconolactonase
LHTVARDIEIVVAERPAETVGERLAAFARGGGHIALTGGRTPRAAYEHAAKLEPDWTNVDIWWGDERCVPPDDERSNYRLAKESLLDSVQTRAVHRIRGELGRDEGAVLYEQELTPVDRFDLILLGPGGDGHIASLFPTQPTLDETERRVVGAEAKLEPYVDRVTLTLPTLRRARHVLFLVTGRDKADAAYAAFAGDPSRETPGSLVRATDGETVAVLDEAAAARL